MGTNRRLAAVSIIGCLADVGNDRHLDAVSIIGRLAAVSIIGRLATVSIIGRLATLSIMLGPHWTDSRLSSRLRLSIMINGH